MSRPPLEPASRASISSLLLLAALLALTAAANCAAAGPANGSSADGAGAAETLTAAPLKNGVTEQELLNWALAHSDPEALRQAAEEARRGAESGSEDFRQRQAKVQALLDAMKQEPTEAELMQEAVAILKNSSATQEQLGGALEALRILVEPIDLANDLHKVGGLAPLVALLAAHQPPELQARAAHALGTAAANNIAFQRQLLGDHPETLGLLLRLLAGGGAEGGSSAGGGGSSGAGASAGTQEAAASKGRAGAAPAPASSASEQEAATKALYCLSALLRLSPPARAAFYRGGGMATLQALLRWRQGAASSSGTGGQPPSLLSLQRKALGLLADLAQLDASAAARGTPAGAAAAAAGGLDAAAAAAAALHVLEGEAAASQGQQDYDLQEKALLVLLALLEGGREGAAAAAAQAMAASGGRATLRRLEAGWHRHAAADEGDLFLQDLLALSQRVWRAAAAAGGGGSGIAAGALGGVGGGSGHDATEL